MRASLHKGLNSPLSEPFPGTPWFVFSATMELRSVSAPEKLAITPLTLLSIRVLSMVADASVAPFARLIPAWPPRM